MTTIGESISRVRNILKSSKQEAYLTDRFIYSLLLKYAKTFVKRQDMLNARLKFASLFRTLPCEALMEVSKIEACCGNISSDCKVMRTVNKLPIPLEGSFGPFIRTVSSIDGSTEVYRTQPAAYVSMTKTSNFKYNKSKYYWYMNGYLYFPNIEWPSISAEGIWQDDISIFTCEQEKICGIRQEDTFPIPDDLFSEIEKQVLQDLGFTIQIPIDKNPSDKQNIIR